ncbi:MAG: CPBP family glutamic-type intramembrane protease [Aggregatilineales bacterium]
MRPPDDLPPYAADAGDDDLPDFSLPPASRGLTSDPAFGYLIALALAIGLAALPREQYDLRYTLLWMLLAGFGVLAWLLGTMTRIGQETPENLAWGVVFGLIIATPLLAVGGSTLTTTVNLLFGMLSSGALLAYLVFVMPLAETLFFRGILQEQRPFWVVGLMSSLWGALLFFPVLDFQRYPAVVAIIGVALAMMNLTYSYVRQRNGLAAAWVCQIVVNLVLLFVPFVSR